MRRIAHGGRPRGAERREPKAYRVPLHLGSMSDKIQEVVTKASLTEPERVIEVAQNSTTDQVREAFGRAADEAVKTHQPVYVHMD